MDQNPYESPGSSLDQAASIDVPEEIKKKIKNAWVAGIISIALTIVVTLISLYGTSIMGLGWEAFVDVGLMCIFTYGIYRNSRTCALLMLMFFLLNKIVMFMESGSISGLPIALLFLWFYSQGVIGTFQYRSHVKKSLNKSLQPTAEASAE